MRELMLGEVALGAIAVSFNGRRSGTGHAMKQALELLRELRQDRAATGMITFNSSIGACEFHML